MIILTGQTVVPADVITQLSLDQVIIVEFGRKPPGPIR
jgi:hypothetical protein